MAHHTEPGADAAEAAATGWAQQHKVSGASIYAPRNVEDWAVQTELLRDEIKNLNSRKEKNILKY